MDKELDYDYYQNLKFTGNPNKRSFDDNVNFSLKWYGVIFGGIDTRYKILDHLFFTNGNGYIWLDGRLVDCYKGTDESLHKDHLKDWEYNCIQQREKIERYKQRLEECTPEDVDRIRFTNDSIDDANEIINNFDPFMNGLRKHRHRLIDKGVYDLPTDISSYCKISEIPDDVKDDYLLGALEMTDFYLERFKDEHESPRYQELVTLKSNLVSKFNTRLIELKYLKN